MHASASVKGGGNIIINYGEGAARGRILYPDTMASAEPPRHHTTTEAVKEPCVPLAIEPSRVVLYGIIINMQG
jgi:hypothetical protein